MVYPSRFNAGMGVLMPKSYVIRPVFFITLGLFALCAGQVFAQDQPSSYDDELVLEEVIVTGTRIISEDGFGQTSPVTVVDMEAHDVTLDVNNILDTSPPLVGGTIDTWGYHVPLGRYLFAQLALRW